MDKLVVIAGTYLSSTFGLAVKPTSTIPVSTFFLPLQPHSSRFIYPLTYPFFFISLSFLT
jgi:hypothetical protein